MEKVKKIVLIGASGFVGSALLNEALNRGFEVTAVVRHPEKIKIENENLKVVKADVSALDEVAAVCKGADAVISAFNPGWNNPDIYDETIKVYLTIIDGVKKAGVNRFLMVGRSEEHTSELQSLACLVCRLLLEKKKKKKRKEIKKKKNRRKKKNN